MRRNTGSRNEWLVTIAAISAAFSTYFCMYAFRKPFTAVAWEGTFADTEIALKTAYVISQILGYTLSKFLGIKFNAELKNEARVRTLVVLIVIAELALLGFAVAPGSWKIVALFANGLPLGMVWGVVVRFLEGRKTSEVMLAGLSCAYIVSSAIVKDFGIWLIDDVGVAPIWMPATTGLIFFPGFLLSAYCLKLLPEPAAEDIAERSERSAMSGRQRTQFLREHWTALVPLLIVYFFVTAFRDFRDNYGIEMFDSLGYAGEPAIFAKAELPVAFGVMVILGCLSLIRNNRRGLVTAYGIMAGGLVLCGIATALLSRGAVSGLVWMVLIGLGSYLTYVPFGSMLFDRVFAYTRAAGTAVFTIYLADAIGYTGSVGLQLYKDFAEPSTSRLEFFEGYTYGVAAGGTVLLFISCIAFLRSVEHSTKRGDREHAMD